MNPVLAKAEVPLSAYELSREVTIYNNRQGLSTLFANILDIYKLGSDMFTLSVYVSLIWHVQ